MLHYISSFRLHLLNCRLRATNRANQDDDVDGDCDCVVIMVMMMIVIEMNDLIRSRDGWLDLTAARWALVSFGGVGCGCSRSGRELRTGLVWSSLG